MFSSGLGTPHFRSLRDAAPPLLAARPDPATGVMLSERVPPVLASSSPARAPTHWHSPTPAPARQLLMMRMDTAVSQFLCRLVLPARFLSRRMGTSRPHCSPRTQSPPYGQPSRPTGGSHALLLVLVESRLPRRRGVLPCPLCALILPALQLAEFSTRHVSRGTAAVVDGDAATALRKSSVVTWTRPLTLSYPLFSPSLSFTLRSNTLHGGVERTALPHFVLAYADGVDLARPLTHSALLLRCTMALSLLFLAALFSREDALRAVLATWSYPCSDLVMSKLGWPSSLARTLPAAPHRRMMTAAPTGDDKAKTLAAGGILPGAWAGEVRGEIYALVYLRAIYANHQVVGLAVHCFMPWISFCVVEHPTIMASFFESSLGANPPL
ncbi:hypothetical protein C8J57DRAFT_1713677 [Mycena rebaudengoi]|nr:hypothetical protein C8J57DRAFT_1713677 [Mycena rebaudengoi]